LGQLSRHRGQQQHHQFAAHEEFVLPAEAVKWEMSA
jgi:hypothetical protein